MTKFKVGDKVRFIGDSEDFNDYVTYGKVYEISNVSRTGIAEFRDDEDDAESCSVIHANKEHLFELVTEESPLSESDLIANLALRVHDIERNTQTEVGADNVNHPSHYTQGGVEVIDIIRDAVKGAEPFEAVCLANVLKYILRYRNKNGLEDLKKSQVYLGWLVRELEK